MVALLANEENKERQKGPHRIHLVENRAVSSMWAQGVGLTRLTVGFPTVQWHRFVDGRLKKLSQK